MKTIQVGNYKVNYDLNRILNQIDSLTWDEDDQNPREAGEHYVMTELQFNSSKTSFKNSIANIEPNLESLFKDKVRLTKKGKMDARKNHVLYESSLITNYDDNYGSHSYTVPSLQVISTGENTAEIIFNSVSHQDPF